MLRAKVSFAVRVDGQTRVIGMGQTIDDNHPLVSEYPENFEPIRADLRWEQETAAPGEVRHVQPAINDDTTADEEENSKVEETVVEESSSDTQSGGVELIEDPEAFSKAELQTIARREGVADYGTKEAIAERINAKRSGG